MFTNNLAKSNLLNSGGLNMPSKEIVERMCMDHPQICWVYNKKTIQYKENLRWPNQFSCPAYGCLFQLLLPSWKETAESKHNERHVIVALWKFLVAATQTNLQTKPQLLLGKINTRIASIIHISNENVV